MRSNPPSSHTPPEPSGSPLSRVVLDLRESISLRTAEGLFFGELTRFGGGRMEVESEGRFELRGDVEFQLKLPGFNSTVYGVARVLRVISRTAFLNQLTLRILRMRDKDRVLLQKYVAYSARGRSQEQSAWDGEGDAGEGNPWGIQSLDHEQQTAAGRMAQRDAQRHRFEPSAGPPSHPPDGERVRVPVSPPSRTSSASSSPPSRGGPAPSRSTPEPSGVRVPVLGAASSSSSAARSAGSSSSGGRRPEGSRPTTGRAAVREAIERHAEARAARRRGEPDISDREGRVEPQPPPRPAPAQRKERRAEPRPAPPPAHSRTPRLPNPADPQVSLRLGATPPQVFVRYSSRATFLSDYQAFLSRDLIFLPYIQDPPALGLRMSVNMMLPSGLGLTIDATVNSVLSTGFGLSLALDRDARAVLASATRV